MKESEINALIERCEDYAEHWTNGLDLKFSTAVRLGMRLLIREIKRIYQGEEK